MHELISVLKANEYSPYREEWLLDNNLSIFIDFWKNAIEINVSSSSGCIADQIYEKRMILNDEVE